MSGTNIVAAKAAILALLQAAPALAGVQVEYTFPGRTLERETIYGGKITFQQDYSTFASPTVTSGRQPRRETAVLSWHIEVRQADLDAPGADLRAVQLGGVLEDIIASDPTLGGQSGILALAITSGDLEQVQDDDAVSSVLGYQITVRSDLS